ncbi:hypothetical protein [Nonomuraea rubra]|uniref:hypothetical protein n=1 Tax=Nonomuraea rubra TaxID=46180 RepID=UPI0031EA4077
MSTIAIPVTQTADVAVNSAATQPADTPSAVEIGSASRVVPTAAVRPNAATTTWAGCLNGR